MHIHSAYVASNYTISHGFCPQLYSVFNTYNTCECEKIERRRMFALSIFECTAETVWQHEMRLTHLECVCVCVCVTEVCVLSFQLRLSVCMNYDSKLVTIASRSKVVVIHGTICRFSAQTESTLPFASPLRVTNVEISAVLFSIIVMHASLSNTESGRRVLDSSNHHADSTLYIFRGGYLHSDNRAPRKDSESVTGTWSKWTLCDESLVWSRRPSVASFSNSRNLQLCVSPIGISPSIKKLNIRNIQFHKFYRDSRTRKI